MLENSEFIKKHHEITDFFLLVLRSFGEDPSTPPKRVPLYCKPAKFGSETFSEGIALQS